MKRILIIMFVASSLCADIVAQSNSKIDVDLQQEMTLREANELIPINIILNQQYDQMETRMKSDVFETREEKRTFVVGELQRFSEETQHGIMDLLSATSTVSEVQSFWIANFVNCYANIEAIEELSLHPDVLIIGFDKEYCMIPEVEISKDNGPTRNENH